MTASIAPSTDGTLSSTVDLERNALPPILEFQADLISASQITLTNTTSIPDNNQYQAHTRIAAAKQRDCCSIFGPFLVILFVCAALGGIIYGIYRHVHGNKMAEAAQAQQEAEVAAKLVMANLKGPEVFWEMLKEFKEFKAMMQEEMKALRGVSAATVTTVI